ncbi:MAG: ABC transporter ATP-binding protein [Epsilonproteobacteria bacterium]|nr:ABC transporter ATP-binding protein [Campylobacterota bacterium]
MQIIINNAYKKFLGEWVLDGVNLEIKSGDKIAMMGPNGAGKTTLVRAILGFYHLNRGKILVDGFEPTKKRVEVLKRVSFIPQLPPPIKLSLKELLEFVSKSSNINKKEIFNEADRLELNLEKNINKQFFKLSGGMKQKLLIAIALAKKSPILIFDEPTANLDPKSREKFYELLKEVDRNAITLFITHRIDEIIGLVNRKVYMELGKVVEDEKI